MTRAYALAMLARGQSAVVVTRSPLPGHIGKRWRLVGVYDADSDDAKVAADGNTMGYYCSVALSDIEPATQQVREEGRAMRVDELLANTNLNGLRVRVNHGPYMGHEGRFVSFREYAGDAVGLCDVILDINRATRNFGPCYLDVIDPAPASAPTPPATHPWLPGTRVREATSNAVRYLAFPIPHADTVGGPPGMPDPGSWWLATDRPGHGGAVSFVNVAYAVRDEGGRGKVAHEGEGNHT